MLLDDIGFYTISEHRAGQASELSPLWRCELLITASCNFRCVYCRGTSKDANISYDDARRVVDAWLAEGLKHVRFSGGEPTLVEWLPKLVQHCADRGVKRTAVSTNGSARWSTYGALLDAGVNDWSVSLDACCAASAGAMSGRNGVWDIIRENIRCLTRFSYVTVGVVLTERNEAEAAEIVRLASDELGVADIRLIPAAQHGCNLPPLDIPEATLAKHPILRYRVERMADGQPTRGLRASDNDRCPLALDDMAVCGDHHFPCIIALREGAKPIGRVGPDMRAERAEWARTHDTHADPICSKNCLDVCVAYNNRMRRRGT